MRIAVVGGRERSDEQLARIAARAGYELEFHAGHMNGGVQELKAAIARSKLVVIITEINSHGAVSVAKRAARQLERPMLVMRKLTASRLKLLLAALAARDYRELDATAVAAP